MMTTVELPLWLFMLILLFAAVTFASHFLFPSVRWFFRRRLERAVAQLNERLTRPIEPFKLARRHDMIQRLIYDPEVSEAIVRYADEHDVPENVAFEQARRYAREIVPSFSAFAYFSFGARAARWLATALYNVRTGLNNDQQIQSADPNATVVFVMNHRSNMDYVLVTYLAAQASALSYAVGEWARVWPLSRLIKSMGAYFIRRKSRGVLYRAVLARYVRMATEGGVTQAIFPEGGLSVNGKLMPLKKGLLSYVVDGYDPDKRDVVFVPVAINYDRVLEDRVLIAADARGDRRFGVSITVVMAAILRLLWQWITRRYRKFGTASVVFGPPVSLAALGDDVELDHLAETLRDRIQDVMPVPFVPLLCRLLLMSPDPLPDLDLVHEVKAAMPPKRGTRPPLLDQDLRDRVLRALTDMEVRGMVKQVSDAWVMQPEEEPLVRFYANSIDDLYPDSITIGNAARAKS
ncbi:1-acyl-sn-glycerol-3-phosphate acyltransferase [Tateyamaria omphalii]|uniref:1-acyl-sn-glycerol-3-phosphate acyltransferase n=1 Tax=Tateyamaria omphalii TaxID=299262 RepID=UPI001C9A1A1F|nr:1-acyl-sn-glycerol-3-phosphate acyltransferase [Tateyamaria omphalii]MBY5933873.1 1-acyl-sn-glycerol-3-phosphate acyltransferase [Tateyamaria omphalii]